MIEPHGRRSDGGRLTRTRRCRGGGGGRSCPGGTRAHQGCVRGLGGGGDSRWRRQSCRSAAGPRGGRRRRWLELGPPSPIPTAGRRGTAMRSWWRRRPASGRSGTAERGGGRRQGNGGGRALLLGLGFEGGKEQRRREQQGQVGGSLSSSGRQGGRPWRAGRSSTAAWQHSEAPVATGRWRFLKNPPDRFSLFTKRSSSSFSYLN